MNQPIENSEIYTIAQDDFIEMTYPIDTGNHAKKNDKNDPFKKQITTSIKSSLESHINDKQNFTLTQDILPSISPTFIFNRKYLNHDIPIVYLAFANSQNDLPKLVKEEEEIKSIFQKLEFNGSLLLEVEPRATPQKLIRAFEKIDNRLLLFHFAGHAGDNSLDLNLENGKNKAFSKGLSGLINKTNPPKIIFLNGCATYEHVGHFKDAGIPIILATSEKVDDNLATDFAISFYTHLANNYSVGQSFNKAKSAIETVNNKIQISHRSLDFKDTYTTDECKWGIYYDNDMDEVLSWKLPITDNNNSLKNLTSTPLDLDLTKIKGRSEDLAKLHNLLLEQNVPILLYGIGGIGKTTFARLYLQKNIDHYKHFIYLNGDLPTKSQMINSIPLISKLGLEFYQDQKEEDRFYYLQLALNELPGPNLLILDNPYENDSDFFRKLITGIQWKKIIIKRNIIPNLEPFKLDQLKNDDALELFKIYYKEKVDDDEIKELIRIVNEHPLTIELLSKILQATPYLTILNLIDSLKNKTLNNEALQTKIASNFTNEYQSIIHHLIQTFHVSIESSITKTEINLLLQFCLFPDSIITFDELTKILSIEEEKYNETVNSINKLIRFGWIESPRIGQYKMHPIIQDALYYQFSPNELVIKSLVNRINNLLEVNILIEDPHKKQIWIKFGEKILTYIEKIDRDCFESIFLRFNLGRIYYLIEIPTRAKELLTNVNFKNIAKHESNIYNLHYLDITAKINLILLDIQLEELSVSPNETIEELITSAKKIEDPFSRNVALNELMLLHIQLGNEKEAEKLSIEIQPVENFQIEFSNYDHLFTHNLRATIGFSQFRKGNIDIAYKIISDVIRYHDENPDLASTLISYTHYFYYLMVLLVLEEREKIQSYLKKLLQVDRIDIPNNHSSILQIKLISGYLLLIEENTKEGQETIEMCIHEFQKKRGRFSSFTIEMGFLLSSICLTIEKFRLGKILATYTLKAQENSNLAIDRYSYLCEMILAHFCSKLGEKDEAEIWIQKIKTLVLNFEGKYDPFTLEELQVLYYAGYTFTNTENFYDANKVFIMMESHKEYLIDKDPEILQRSYINQLCVYKLDGEIQKAEQLLDNFQTIIKNKNVDEVYLKEIKIELAEIYYNNNKIHDSEKILREIINIPLSRPSDLEHWMKSYTFLANIYANNTDKQKILELIELSNNNNLDLFGPNNIGSADLHIFNGMLLAFQVEDYIKSRDLVKKGIQTIEYIDPDYSYLDSYYALEGLICIANNDLDSALQAFDLAINKVSKREYPDKNMLSIYNYLCGSILSDKNIFNEAIDRYEKALLYLQVPDIQMELILGFIQIQKGIAEIGEGKDFSCIETTFDKAQTSINKYESETQENHPLKQYYLKEFGLYCVKQKQYVKAQTLLSNALRLTESGSNDFYSIQNGLNEINSQNK